MRIVFTLKNGRTVEGGCPFNVKSVSGAVDKIEVYHPMLHRPLLFYGSAYYVYNQGSIVHIPGFNFKVVTTHVGVVEPNGIGKGVMLNDYGISVATADFNDKTLFHKDGLQHIIKLG